MIDQPHLDEEALAELRDVMEDEFEILVRTFVADSRSRIRTLRQALPDHDADLLAKTAHSFKGSCINMGAPRLAELCSEVERKGKSGDFATVATLLEHTENEFTGVTRRLEHFLTL